jgi:hypothetical protein
MEIEFKDCDNYLCFIMYLLPKFVWKTAEGKYQHRIISVQPWKYTGSVEVSGQPHSPATFKTALSTHCKGGWLRRQSQSGCSGGDENLLPLPEIEPQIGLWQCIQFYMH